LRLRHRDATWRELLVSVSPIRDETGVLSGVLGIFHDMTDERESQRVKDVFLSVASHELRTPITTIKGMTELLLRTLETRGTVDAAQLTRRLQRIQREADRLALLSTDLLDASRLQEGKLPLRLEQHDLRVIVDACIARQHELLGDAPIHRFVLEQPETAVPVMVERVRTEQVLSNLLSNAVKYAPTGGTVTVTIEVQGQQAVVHVADTGIGIPAQDLPKLFTPFFRGSNASIQTFMGLGLGLYLSKALIEAQGGTLIVASTEGQGTTFTLTLPIAQEATES
jgi:signal transduction histidine kinase